MTRAERKIVFLGVMWVLSNGCAHVKTVESHASKDLGVYLPLKIGNCWSYTTWFHGQPQADLEVCIQSESEGYYLDNRPNPSRWRIDAHGIRDGNTRYILKAPVEIGNTWMSVADVRTVERYEIVEIGKTVSTPAGEFKGCVLVSMEVRLTNTRMLQNQMIFAPDTGIVEIRTILLENGKKMPQSLMQLKSIQLQS